MPTLVLCLFAWITAGVLYPNPAMAQSININTPYPLLIHPDMMMNRYQLNGNTVYQPIGRQICPIDNYNVSNYAAYQANRDKYGIVKRMVYCVQGLVIPATYKIMYQNSVNYFYGPIAAACTLAVLFWGFLMVTGKNSAPMRDAFTVAIKIGAVSFFTFILGQSTIWPDGLFPVIINIVDELSGVVTAYVGYSTTMRCAQGLAVTDIWGKVDCALDTLFGGIFNAGHLLAGLIGFFVSAIFSGTFGLFIALIGFFMIFVLVMAILRATYITITAYVALALMSIVSPIFITMLLFKSTFGYFEKWLRLTIGFMMQPIFLFAYLAMMLAAYDTVIYDGRFSVYRALVGPQYIGSYPNPLPNYPANATANPRGEFQIGTWMFASGFYHEATGASMGVGTNPRLQKYVEEHNVGVLGSTGMEAIGDDKFQKRDSAGILLDVLDNFAPINVYKVDIPMKRISWQDLALARLCNAPGCTPQSKYNELRLQACNVVIGPCTPSGQQRLNQLIQNINTSYLIQLLLSLLIAMLTMYLFYIMLDVLPFIGAGVTGGDKQTPSISNIQMPGNKLMDKVKAGMAKLAPGGAG